MKFRNKEGNGREQKNWNLLDLCAGTNIIELVDRKNRINARIKKASSRGENIEDLCSRRDQLTDRIDEYTELRELIADPATSPGMLRSFLKDKDNHSPAFNKFSESMLTENPMVLSIKYQNKAKQLAQRNDIYTENQGRNITKMYNAATTYRDLKRSTSDRFKKTFKKVAIGALPIALAATIAGCVITSNQTSKEVGGAENPAGIVTTVDTDEIEVTEADIGDEFVPPISEVGTLSSYEDACDAFYTMLSEIYEYNTGESIDLSDCTQSDMSYKRDALEYVVTYNGNTYYFSTTSSYRTNSQNLKKALEAAGATVETTTTNTYGISKNGESIALTDSQGHVVNSGSNVTVESNSGSTEMYNQTYVNEGRKILEAQGVDTSGKSDADFVGAYLLSDNYLDKNAEASLALAEVKSAMSTIKTTFYLKNDGSCDTYAIYLYKNELNKIVSTINEEAHEEYNAEHGITEEENTIDDDEPEL